MRRYLQFEPLLYTKREVLSLKLILMFFTTYFIKNPKQKGKKELLFENYQMGSLNVAINLPVLGSSTKTLKLLTITQYRKAESLWARKNTKELPKHRKELLIWCSSGVDRILNTNKFLKKYVYYFHDSLLYLITGRT